MKTIRQILMNRDGMSADEADELIALVRDELNDYILAGDYDGCQECLESHLGLEPDYLEHFLDI